MTGSLLAGTTDAGPGLTTGPPVVFTAYALRGLEQGGRGKVPGEAARYRIEPGNDADVIGAPLP